VLGVDPADVRETESARCSLNQARADTLLELTDFAADGRLTVDFGIARCLAAAVKLPVSATAAKTTMAFRSGPGWLIVLLTEQSFLRT